VTENGGENGFMATEAPGDGGSAADNDWENATTQVPVIGGGAPIAAVGGW
jgi:hypothetical protein